MPYNQTDFSLEHHCNGQKSHFCSEGSCHLRKPAGLSRNLLEEERIKKMDHYQRKLRSKNNIKENLLGFLTGTLTLKNIELSYDSIILSTTP